MNDVIVVICTGQPTFGDHEFIHQKLDALLRDFRQPAIASDGRPGPSLLSQLFAKEKGFEIVSAGTPGTMDPLVLADATIDAARQYAAHHNTKAVLCCFGIEDPVTRHYLESATALGFPDQYIRVITLP